MAPIHTCLQLRLLVRMTVGCVPSWGALAALTAVLSSSHVVTNTGWSHEAPGQGQGVASPSAKLMLRGNKVLNDALFPYDSCRESFNEGTFSANLGKERPCRQSHCTASFP